MTQKIHLLKTEISILVISNHNSFRVLFGKNCFRIFSLKSFYILALEMASPGNQHCATCIGTLSFPITQAAESILHDVIVVLVVVLRD